MAKRVYQLDKKGNRIYNFSLGGDLFHTSYDTPEHDKELADVKARVAQEEIDKEVAIRLAVEKALKKPKE